jgi:hypothetical protein
MIPEEDTDSGLCCQLDLLSRAERAAHAWMVEELFGDAVLGHSERSDGYDFVFETERLPELLRFIELERRCCPFLRLVMEIEGGGEAVRLQITGPRGGKQVIEAELLA